MCVFIVVCSLVRVVPFVCDVLLILCLLCLVTVYGLLFVSASRIHVDHLFVAVYSSLFCLVCVVLFVFAFVLGCCLCLLFVLFVFSVCCLLVLPFMLV